MCIVDHDEQNEVSNVCKIATTWVKMVTKASLNYTSDKDEALQRQSIILTSSEIWDFFQCGSIERTIYCFQLVN